MSLNEHARLLGRLFVLPAALAFLLSCAGPPEVVPVPSDPLLPPLGAKASQLLLPQGPPRRGESRDLLGAYFLGETRLLLFVREGIRSGTGPERTWGAVYEVGGELLKLVREMPLADDAPTFHASHGDGKGSAYLAARAGSTDKLHVWRVDSDLRVTEDKLKPRPMDISLTTSSSGRLLMAFDEWEMVFPPHINRPNLTVTEVEGEGIETLFTLKGSWVRGYQNSALAITPDDAVHVLYRFSGDPEKIGYRVWRSGRVSGERLLAEGSSYALNLVEIGGELWAVWSRRGAFACKVSDRRSQVLDLGVSAGQIHAVRLGEEILVATTGRSAHVFSLREGKRGPLLRVGGSSKNPWLAASPEGKVVFIWQVRDQIFAKEIR